MTPKRIVITGATRGLGRALAEWFIQQGHTVAGCGRRAEEIQRLAAAHSPPHCFFAVDVSDAAAVGDWAAAVLGVMGAPDLLVNNAALMNRPAPLWQVPAEEFSRLIDVNVKGVANVIRAFVPAMIDASRGVVVNLSSGWGRSVSPEVAPYCASKYAIEGLTLALAEELPRGLAAVPLNPGIINTEMLRTCWPTDAAGYPEASEWAKAAGPFLLGLGPRHNGQSLTVPSA